MVAVLLSLGESAENCLTQKIPEQINEEDFYIGKLTCLQRDMANQLINFTENSQSLFLQYFF